MKHSKKSNRVVATHHVNDAWGLDWDCNTDALDLEDAYKKHGRKMSFLADRVNDDDMKYSNNTCRAACYLIWKHHYKDCSPEIATKILSFLKYLVSDTKWMNEMSKHGDVHQALRGELGKAKDLARDAGTLGEMLESYNRSHARVDLKALASMLSKQGSNVRVVM